MIGCDWFSQTWIFEHALLTRYDTCMDTLVTLLSIFSYRRAVAAVGLWHEHDIAGSGDSVQLIKPHSVADIEDDHAGMRTKSADIGELVVSHRAECSASAGQLILYSVPTS